MVDVLDRNFTSWCCRDDFRFQSVGQFISDWCTVACQSYREDGAVLIDNDILDLTHGIQTTPCFGVRVIGNSLPDGVGGQVAHDRSRNAMGGLRFFGFSQGRDVAVSRIYRKKRSVGRKRTEGGFDSLNTIMANVVSHRTLHCELLVA